MRIISPKLLKDFVDSHARAEASFREWTHKTKAAQWRTFEDVRSTFSAADSVTLPSRKTGLDERGRPRTKTVVIFNVGGNDYRIIASINYKTQIVYTLFALTHAEYGKQEWKKQL